MKNLRRASAYLSLPFAVACIVTWVSSSDAIHSGSSPGEFACFVYHRFGDSRYPSTNIAIDTFRSQLEFLRNFKYTVFTLGDAIEKLQSAAGVPEKTVVLTVDDGYMSFLTGAMPLLREFGFNATLFINSATVGHKGYMRWDELRGLVAEGMEIGNHSATHPYFLDIDEETLLSKFNEDVGKAQKEIEAHLGIAPKVFSYPFGEYNLDMKRAVQELGFRAAAAQNSGIVYGDSDLYALPRFPMGGPYATLDGFRTKIGMKALEVIEKVPDSPLLRGPNPPELKLVLAAAVLNMKAIQCFVEGEPRCTIRRDPADPNIITVKAEEPLKGRRVLYTVTAPSIDGKAWHWFSHLWVQPR